MMKNQVTLKYILITILTGTIVWWIVNHPIINRTIIKICFDSTLIVGNNPSSLNRVLVGEIFAYNQCDETVQREVAPVSFDTEDEYEEIIDFEVPHISIAKEELETIPVVNEVVSPVYDYNSVLKKYYVVPKGTTLRKEVLDLNKINSMDLSLIKKKEPQILILHTHSQEAFMDYSSNHKTIVDAGQYLGDLLTQKGYSVMHLTDTFDIMDGHLDRSKAYNYANAKIEEVLKEHPSIDVIIDLHRDGVSDKTHLVTEINNKKTAKIMLFNGISYSDAKGDIDYLYNPYLTENLAMTYKLNLIGRELYPDYIRCIYIQSYRYCLHHRARSLLIEAGAQTNTYEEIRNAMEPLAEMLDRLFTPAQ